jgi:Domain of unknown function (DUF5103)
MKQMRFLCCLLFYGMHAALLAQAPDSVYTPNIKTAQLYVVGNQLTYPVIRLGSTDRLNLKFDDLDGDTKNYFYTYQLCNADWSPAIISTFDYIRGFTQVRIERYRFSSVAYTKYTHYEIAVPDPTCVPTRSGNYLLKVFLDGDTSHIAFTKRFLVTEQKATVTSQFLQPYNLQYTQTHQKIQFSVNTGLLNLINPLQQVKVVMLQNYRWDNAVYLDQPTFYSGSTFEYSNDDLNIFPAGKQWRWLDLQSFRYQSDRVQRAIYGKSATTIYVKPDAERAHMPYYFYADYNGQYYIQTTDNYDPNWQTDYATVVFSFLPAGNEPFNDKDLYIFGKMTDYKLNESTKMNYNAELGIYQDSLFLKQGYYNYAYVTVDRNDPARRASFEFTEGNNFETENDYTILVYYRVLGERSDQLVGISRLNSLNGQQ